MSAALWLPRFLQFEDEIEITAAPVVQDIDMYDDIEAASQVALLLPRITGFLSLLAVVCVLVEAALDLKPLEDDPIQARTPLASHVQVFYQIPLLFFSIAFVWGTSPVPASTQVWGAYGNGTTCTAQGFLLQFGLFGSMAWDAILSWTYLRMSQGKTKSRCRIYHLLVWPFTLLVSIYPLLPGQDLYQFNHTVCWIRQDNQCYDESEEDEGVCEGDADLWIGVTSLLAFVHLIYSVMIMMCLYRTIRQSEKHMTGSSARTEDSSAGDEEDDDEDDEHQQEHSHADHTVNYGFYRNIGIQGMLYASGLVFVMLPTAVYMILYNATGVWNSSLSAFAITLAPLAGYVNFCIFMRDRHVEECHTGYGRFMRRLHCWLGEPSREEEEDHMKYEEAASRRSHDGDDEDGQQRKSMEKQKVLSSLQESQSQYVDEADMTIISVPPRAFFGCWESIKAWVHDLGDERSVVSDEGVFGAPSKHKRRNGGMDGSGNNRRSQRTFTTSTCDLHDSIPSASPPMMSNQRAVASEPIARTLSEAFRGGCTSGSEEFDDDDDEEEPQGRLQQGSYLAHTPFQYPAAPPRQPLRYDTDHESRAESTAASFPFGSQYETDGESRAETFSRYETDGESTAVSFPGVEESTVGESTWGGDASTWGGDMSMFGAESTIASFPESVQQAIIIECLNNNRSSHHQKRATPNKAPPSRPVRYDTDADSCVETVASAIECLLESTKKKVGLRKPLRYDTCSEAEESDMDTFADSVYSRKSSRSGFGEEEAGAPNWARRILEQVEASENDPSGNNAPLKPIRYETDAESILESVAEDDLPDLEALGQALPPDWAIQYLRKVAMSESGGYDEPSLDLSAPPIQEIVAKERSKKPSPPPSKPAPQRLPPSRFGAVKAADAAKFSPSKPSASSRFTPPKTLSKHLGSAPARPVRAPSEGDISGVDSIDMNGDDSLRFI